MLNLSFKGSFSSVQFQFQAVLAVGAGRSLRHSLETLVVHPAPEQTAAPGQPPLPHPCVGPLLPTYTGGGAANMNYCTTLAFTFLCCALGVGQFVRFVGGFALFCCFVFWVFFCLSLQDPSWQWSETAQGVMGRRFVWLLLRLSAFGKHFFCLIVRRMDALEPSQVTNDL